MRAARRLLPRLLLALAVAASGCGRREDAPRAAGTRAVVIGIDGADWKLIDALAARGRMPNLERLRARGVSGPLETLNDIALSPVIWTSIATGKTAVKHGISWFMVDQPDGTRVPVRSSNRKVKALWNIVAGAGRTPVVVGWWATYPAEPLARGIVVSDALGFHGFGATARDGDDGLKTQPRALFAELDALVPPEQQVSPDFVRRFVHITPEEYRQEMFDPGRYPRRDPGNPVHLFQQYAVTAQGYTEIASRLLARERYDLFLVYYEQVDSFSHLFMKYAPPPLPWVDAAAAARYGDVVSEWYVYQDELLGRLLAGIDLETTAVFVVSDHGFKSGERRIRSEETVDIKRAHLDHEREGILIAAGPHIPRGARLAGASVLDVTPTVLHYLGFPVAKDMDGKVLEGAFEPDFLRRDPIRYIASYETPGSGATGAVAGTTGAPPDGSGDALAQEEREEQLRALGYIGASAGEAVATATASPAPAGASGAAAGADASSPEMHNNLGRILLRDGDTAKARREFEKALELDPKNADALLNLASTLGAEGRTAEAEQLVKRALAVNPDSIAALAALASMQRDQGKLDEAIRLFREAAKIDGSQPFIHLGLGDCLQRAGRFKEAEKEFRAVLELEPDSFQARYNLGVTYANQGREAEAIAQYLEAVKLDERNPENSTAYNNLGAMALDKGEGDKAEEWFTRAVKASPVNLEARYNLALLYLTRNRNDDAIKLLEEAAKLAPNHELVNVRLGMAYLAVGRGDDAYRSLSLVRRLYPKNWLAPLGIAALHAAVDHPDDARRELAVALELGGKEARAAAANFPVLAGLPGAPPRSN